MINFNCPKCKKKIKAPDAVAGRNVPCPSCNARIDVPKSDAPVEPVAKPVSSNLFDDSDLNLQPAPIPPAPPAPPPPVQSLGDLGLSDVPAPDPFGKAFHNYAPPEPVVEQSQRQVSNSDVIPLPKSRTYFALTIVRYALLVLAALEGIAWLITAGIMFIAFIASDAEKRGGVATVGVLYLLATFFGGAIICCLLVAGSELIKLAMDIQSNTLETAKASRR